MILDYGPAVGVSGNVLAGNVAKYQLMFVQFHKHSIRSFTEKINIKRLNTHMKNFFIALSIVVLSGCAQIKSQIPSFWDDNQSAKIVDISVSAQQINCDQPHRPQALALQRELLWFHTYGVAKGWRQQDVLRLTEPIEHTVNDWVKRTETSKDNPTYCELKKKIMVEQTKRAAAAVLGRF